MQKSLKNGVIVGLALAGGCLLAQSQLKLRDPRSFPFNEAASPSAAIFPQPSTSGFGEHARATNDPTFIAQELLGRPTDTSVTIDAKATKPLEVFYEYGTKSGTYSGKTPAKVYGSEDPFNVFIDGLKPNTEYYYRMRYREPDAKVFAMRAEHSFHTARPAGSTYTYVLQFDPHMMEDNNEEAYKSTLRKMLADHPDFMIDLGDNFFVDREKPATQKHIVERVELLRSYYDLLNHSVPLFLALGNHEGEWGRNLDGTDHNVAVMDTIQRKRYFPNQVPNAFYSGSTREEAIVGLRQANYAWTWGDATFIVLDPYWNRPKAPEMEGDWFTTLGKEQYDWLRKTLETSHAKYKFIFSHNLIGGLDMKGLMRGGIETVKYTEMGGHNYDGTWGWDKARPGWYKPIHQLLVENNATIYFHGHDHLYVHQELDGMTYQEGPMPSRRGKFDATKSAKDYNYTHGTVLGGSGYIRVKVSPDDVKVDYVQTYLPDEEDATHKDGQVADSYTLKARKFNPAAYEQ